MMMLCGVCHILNTAVDKLYRHHVAVRHEQHLFPTLIDANDAISVETLVRKLDDGSGTDGLLQRLTRVYERFPPNEKIMQRLSLMQQYFDGVGDATEFCIICVFTVAMDVVPRFSQKRMTRVYTMPNMYVRSELPQGCTK